MLHTGMERSEVMYFLRELKIFSYFRRQANEYRMHKDNIDGRVGSLRRWMRQQGCDAFLVPTSDPHGSEYIAAHWQSRAWLTGFTGSAGLALVTADVALLWTDSRYWLQAAVQLENTPFTLMKDGSPNTATPAEWLRVNLPEGSTVAFCNQTMAYAEMEHLTRRCEEVFNVVGTNEDPFDEIWTDRPLLPDAPLELQPAEFVGEDVALKMEQFWQAVQKQGKYIEHYLITDLSEIAWILNLRGRDIDYNPVFTAYLILHTDCTATLFVEKEKVLPVRGYLDTCGIEVRPYGEILEAVVELLDAKSPIGLPKTANCAIIAQLQERTPHEQFLLYPSPIPMLRAVKSAKEQEGFRRAMERDGVAMVRLLRQIDEGTAGKTEKEVADTLESLRAEQMLFRGLSFGTISAYGANGAVVHYEPTAESDTALQPHSFLLLDSGAQYLDGTTDITRTISLGTLTDEERLAYTLVLKGHIELASLRFPLGICGLELDLAARRAMWKAGYDFGHGTGHGVGSHLCVHEGPQQIRKDVRAATTIPFLPGMTITDEPGIYVAGKFGVRIENMLLVVPDGETAFGQFCRFETLTLCPIDVRPVRKELLTSEEIAWLNHYHREVRRRLLPLLTDEQDKTWLQTATQEI